MNLSRGRGGNQEGSTLPGLLLSKLTVNSFLKLGISGVEGEHGRWGVAGTEGATLRKRREILVPGEMTQLGECMY